MRISFDLGYTPDFELINLQWWLRERTAKNELGFEMVLNRPLDNNDTWSVDIGQVDSKQLFATLKEWFNSRLTKREFNNGTPLIDKARWFGVLYKTFLTVWMVVQPDRLRLPFCLSLDSGWEEEMLQTNFMQHLANSKGLTLDRPEKPFIQKYLNIVKNDPRTKNIEADEVALGFLLTSLYELVEF